MSENEQKPRNSRRWFRLLLAVLLLFAIGWNVWNYTHPGETIIPLPPAYTAPVLEPSPESVTRASPPRASQSFQSRGPGWRAVVRSEKADGGSKITIYSIIGTGNPGKLQSFQIWAPDAEGKEQDITAQFTANDKEELTGVLKNHGRVPLRIRLHRAESTLELTELLDLP